MPEPMKLLVREALIGFNDDAGVIVAAGDPAQVHPTNLALYVAKGYVKPKSDKDNEAVADTPTASGVTAAAVEGASVPERKGHGKG